MDLLQETVKITSSQGGQVDAVLAAVFAICQSIPPDSPLAKNIAHRLEMDYSSKLQAVTNQEYFDGYESVMDLLGEALQEQPNG